MNSLNKAYNILKYCDTTYPLTLSLLSKIDPNHLLNGDAVIIVFNDTLIYRIGIVICNSQLGRIDTIVDEFGIEYKIFPELIQERAYISLYGINSEYIIDSNGISEFNLGSCIIIQNIQYKYVITLDTPELLMTQGIIPANKIRVGDFLNGYKKVTGIKYYMMSNKIIINIDNEIEYRVNLYDNIHIFRLQLYNIKE